MNCERMLFESMEETSVLRDENERLRAHQDTYREAIDELVRVICQLRKQTSQWQAEKGRLVRRVEKLEFELNQFQSPESGYIEKISILEDENRKLKAMIEEWEKEDEHR